MGKRRIPVEVEAGLMLFRGWIPGQVPGGKNQTVLKEGRDGKLRTMPRRRGRKRAAERFPDLIRDPRAVARAVAHLDDDRTPFERWRDPAVKLYKIRSKMRPRDCAAAIHEGPIRLIVNYWWGDWNGRDEDGRMGALGHVLQNGKVIQNDGQLRQLWRYHWQDAERPGISFCGWAEPIECSDPSWPPEPIESDHRTRDGFSLDDLKVPGVIFL